MAESVASCLALEAELEEPPTTWPCRPATCLPAPPPPLGWSRRRLARRGVGSDRARGARWRQARLRDRRRPPPHTSPARAPPPTAAASSPRAWPSSTTYSAVASRWAPSFSSSTERARRRRAGKERVVVVWGGVLGRSAASPDHPRARPDDRPPTAPPARSPARSLVSPGPRIGELRAASMLCRGGTVAGSLGLVLRRGGVRRRWRGGRRTGGRGGRRRQGG